MAKGHAIQIYTDGSYSYQLGKKGGYGAVMSYNKRLKKFSCPHHWVDTSASRMEMRAIISALRVCDTGYNIDIYSDNKNCIDVVNVFFSRKLSKKRMRNYENNWDLWSKMFDQIIRHRQSGSLMTINFVRSHSGNTFNEIADKLANKSRKQEKGKVCK